MGIDLLIFNSGEIRLRIRKKKIIIRKTKHSITQRDLGKVKFLLQHSGLCYVYVYSPYLAHAENVSISVFN